MDKIANFQNGTNQRRFNKNYCRGGKYSLEVYDDSHRHRALWEFSYWETGPHSTRDNFLAFWKSKYMPKEYNGISELLYDILRNGVSHSFIAKGGVIPSREKKSAHKHLRYFKQGIFIYADKLGEDVTGGLVMYLEDKKNNPELNQKYNNVLKELIQDGESKYDKFITRNKIQVSIEPIIGDIYPDI